MHLTKTNLMISYNKSEKHQTPRTSRQLTRRHKQRTPEHSHSNPRNLKKCGTLETHKQIGRSFITVTPPAYRTSLQMFHRTRFAPTMNNVLPLPSVEQTTLFPPQLRNKTFHAEFVEHSSGDTNPLTQTHTARFSSICTHNQIYQCIHGIRS